MASSSSNETSRHCRNQQTGESCETSAVSSSHTNWELPGAEPETTHLRQCTEDPPLRRSSSPVSEGLRRDFIARHSIDRGLIESLYTDGRGLPCLDPKRSLDNSLVDGLRSASEAYSERPHFRAMGASSYERLEGAFQHSVAKGATALVERRLQEREEQEQFMREPQREKQMIREERQREELTRVKRQEQMIREHRERKEWEESMRGLQREEHEVREEREREKREQLKRELQRKEEIIREEREREEREEFTRKLQRRERMIREEGERERRENEDREWQEAEKWPPQQEGISIDPQWLCKHYQRHCRVQFPCCKEFYPCHHCHNSSSWCQNDKAKACDATYLKCSFCQLELEIDANSHVCSRCGKKMADYFCSICKNFTSFKNDPFHCYQCGSCRTLKDKSFHCKGCNVCLLKEQENNHMCRPNAGYERCFFCREVVFCSPYILLCSHVLHFSCAKALVKSGIRNCQVCHKSLPGTLFE